MSFPALLKDSSNIPISSAYIPNGNFVALQASTNTTTDTSGNTSAPALLSLAASNSTSGTLQNSQTGSANGTALSVLGYAGVAFTVNMVGFTGTVTFKGSEDGTNYDPINVIQSGTSTIGTSVTGSTTTSIHIYYAECVGLQSVEAVTSTVSAGNVTVTAHAIPINLAPRIVSNPSIGTNGSTTPTSSMALGASDGTNLQQLLVQSSSNQNLRVALYTGANQQISQKTMANSVPVVMASDYLSDITLIASAAFTTTQTTADQTNTMARGVRVVLNVTSAGTGSITLEIDAKDAASGTYVAQLTGAAVVTNSTNTYVVYPALTPVANSIASDVLPHTWRVKVTSNNANSITFSVGASLLA